MQIALKIDVDTYKGIEDGAARLASFLHSQKIPASFFVSLGPDNSGWAATRLFRHSGFLKKMKRTSALSVYGLRTVLSGTLLPSRPMGTSFREQFREWRDQGFEVSPHGFDHILWHDKAAQWDERRAAKELEKVVKVYRYIFDQDPKSFAAPGWQAGDGTWHAMDNMKLLYHSDTRGTHPYFPIKSSSPAGSGRGSMGSPPKTAGNDVFDTLEIPTTLPTWDEMLAWPATVASAGPPGRSGGDGITRQNIVDETWKRLQQDWLNVWTVHAEFEGTVYFPQFHEFIERAVRERVEWVFLPKLAQDILKAPERVPYDTIKQGNLPGRAGTVSCQLSAIGSQSSES